MAEKNLIKTYMSSSFEKRVDIIIKNYTNFMGIVDGYTEGLRYMIESEKESNSRQSIGDLGVRVQSGGMPSDTTAKKAIRNVLTRDSLINCDFSGNVLEGVDRAELYIRDAYILRDMRKDYNLFNSQLGILGTEQDMFLRYIRKEATLGVLGLPIGDSYLRNKMQDIIDELGLPDVVFHSLRHTSVTYKLKLSGGDIKAVQGDSGHAQADMVTEVYGHIIDEDRRKNAEMMENAFYNKENLNPQMKGSEEGSNTIAVPEGVDAELLMKVLGNPEMAALLTSLAKTMKK